MRRGKVPTMEKGADGAAFASAARSLFLFSLRARKGIEMGSSMTVGVTVTHQVALHSHLIALCEATADRQSRECSLFRLPKRRLVGDNPWRVAGRPSNVIKRQLAGSVS
jgi:hypothetical protein